MAARQEAMQSGRSLLVHFWATWCGPCQRLETSVFQQPGVVATIQQNFVPVKLNADENRQIAHAYGVKVLPTDVIVAPDGTLLARFASPQDPAAYVSQIAPFGIAGRSQGRLAAAAPNQGPSQRPFAPTVPFTGGGEPMQPAARDYAGAASQGAVGRDSALRGDGYGAVLQSPAAASGIGARYANGGINNAANPAAFAALGTPGHYAALNQAVPPQRGPVHQTLPAQPVAGPTQTALSHGTYSAPPQAAAPEQTNIPRAAQAFGHANAPIAQSSRTPLGMEGYCPVTLKREQRWIHGDKRYGILHRGSLYLFVGPAEAQQFWDNPDSFSPALSGIDPVLALDNGATVRGQREHGVEFNGMVFLFSSESTLQHFSRNPERYAAGVRQAMQGTSPTVLR